MRIEIDDVHQCQAYEHPEYHGQYCQCVNCSPKCVDNPCACCDSPVTECDPPKEGGETVLDEKTT